MRTVRCSGRRGRGVQVGSLSVKIKEFVATGPSGPVIEKSTGLDEKSLVQIFKISICPYLSVMW